MPTRATSFYGSHYNRSDNPSSAGDATITFWTCAGTSTTGTYRYAVRAFWLRDQYTATASIYTYSNQTSWNIELAYGSPPTRTKTDNQWIFNGLVYTASAGSIVWYTRPNGGTTTAYTYLVCDAGGTAGFDFLENSQANPLTCYIEGEALKFWSAALSQAEVEAERQYRDAVRASNLWASYRLKTHTNDVNGYQDGSGNGRHLTATGSLATGSFGSPSDILGDAPATGWAGTTITSALG